MSSITIDDLETLCARVADQRELVDAIDEKKSQENRKLADLERTLLEVFTAEGKKSYPSRRGTFTISHRVAYKLPADPEHKALFYDYLKEKGSFEQIVSVNYNTLNSFCKKELEAADDRGEGLSFSIPGIDPPTVTELISFRAAK